jgi:hypothetical protein
MRALVVYESMFGNTAKVAHAVADGLGIHMAVELVQAGKAPAPLTDPVDLVVVGGPTHAFSMTRQNTREDAVRQGAEPGHEAYGIRDWIEHLNAGPHSERVATFDTKATKARHLPGSAARSAAKGLRAHGYSTIAKPESFWVDGVTGPLLDGELERARTWGEQLAAAASAPAAVK